MRCFHWVLAVIVSASAPFAAGARGDVLTTVAWAPDGTTDGTGTGTLLGNTVTYTTVPNAGNAGTTIAVDWGASLATNLVANMGVTSQTAGVIGSNTGSFAQSIGFSSPIVNPILFFNFTDATARLDFGVLNLTLLQANNAQLAGGVLNFAGSSNGFQDGAALRVNGTFGPGTPINFTMFSNGSVTNFDSFGFTVAVPEPSSIVMAGLGLLGTLGLWRVRRIRSAA